MTMISPLKLIQNGEVPERAPTVEELRAHAERVAGAGVERVVELAREGGRLRLREVEEELRGTLFELGRAWLVLFLAMREEHLVREIPAGRGRWMGREFRRAPAIARNLTTMFGTVRYWRTYMRELGAKQRRGYHPLDLSLGMGADRFSWNVLCRVTRLATELSFAGTKSVLSDFIPNTPSTEVIEQAVLGFGEHAEAFFEMQPVPEDDGEVLVIEVDGKAVPTATESELARRRGKRRKKPEGNSPRHRGRAKRTRHPNAPRRKKGDKSKNGKGGTMVVMYTLRRCGTRRLEGPINRRHYVTFASKRHAFAFARREASRRGFGPKDGRVVQLVTDGDNDLARLGLEYLPQAEHTIDMFHVFEKLWEGGGSFFAEGSEELRAWVGEQKQLLFDDDVEAVVTEMKRRLDLIAVTGPGNKGRRKRLSVTLGYIEKRAEKLRYGSLRRRDLVCGTGIVEGAIKNLIGKRCDHGGMRWIKERVQALIHLRCIDANGDWHAFERFVHERRCAAAELDRAPLRLQRATPATEVFRAA